MQKQRRMRSPEVSQQNKTLLATQKSSRFFPRQALSPGGDR
jgi:hypothetical protein